MRLSRTSLPVANSVLNMIIYLTSFSHPFDFAKTLHQQIALCPGLLLMINATFVLLLEFTVGFESNINISSYCRTATCPPHGSYYQKSHFTVGFINLSMSGLEIL